MTFPIGKLPTDLLKKILERYSTTDPRVIVGPQIGEDAAVIDFGQRYLVAKTDPITFASDEIGWYVVNINANDIATMGAIPKWFLVTLLLPEKGSDQCMVESIFNSIHGALSRLGITLCGGHTEITYGLDRPIVIGQMLGEVEKERLVRSSGARKGDRILLSKGLGIEATAIIAREKGEFLENSKKYNHDFIVRCRSYLYDPGISVLKEAMVACQTATVHAMHDPTEGGVSTGLYELAWASHVGLEIWEENLFCSEETKVLCREFGIDPLGAISSGALLIVLRSNDALKVKEEIEKRGIRCEVIGEVREEGFGIKLRKDKELVELTRFSRDEIAKLFENTSGENT